jgi:hypothetical protein
MLPTSFPISTATIPPLKKPAKPVMHPTPMLRAMMAP